MAAGRLKLNGLHPWVREGAEWCIAWADYYSVPVTITSGFRSMAEQRRLRAEWEAGRSKWPANRPGDSAHNWGLAFDSHVPEWAESWWRELRELAGFRIPTADPIHAEVPDWRELVG